MNVIDRVLGGFGYSRLYSGAHSYLERNGTTSFIKGIDMLEIAKQNPVLTACIEIRAKRLSQADFYIEDANGERIENHPVIKLINDPNAHQSKQDFLKQYEWFKCAYGWVYQRPFGAVGFKPDAMFNLRSAGVQFDRKTNNPLVYSKKDVDAFYRQKFHYSTEYDRASYELKSIIPFYQLTNGLSIQNESVIKGESPIVSIIKQISNIGIAGDAENVMLQTNGREVISGGTKKGELGSSLPLNVKDKNEIEKKLINGYGFGASRKRSIAVNDPIDWKSLHIPLKELGLHESIEKNADLVRSVYEVPNELYAAHTKGSTYENQKEALIGFIQGVIQPIADDLANSWTKHFDLEQTPIKASFKHLPVMQHTEDKKADKILKIAMAYEKLTRSQLNPDAIDELFRSQGINLNNEEE